MAVNHWSDSPEGLRWFYGGALAHLKSVGMVDPDHLPNVPEADDKMLAIVSEFMLDVKQLSRFETREQAGSAFKAWCRTHRPKPKPAEEQTITVQITKNYGGVSVTLGWSGVFVVRSSGDVRAAFQTAHDTVESQFGWFERDKLPSVNAPLAGSADAGNAQFFGDVIEVEQRNGKTFYKIKGGQWEKFGVRVWPEVLKAAGIDPDQLPVGESRLARDCAVEMNGDKPKKVISIS